MSKLQKAISQNLNKVEFDSPAVHSTFESYNYPPSFSLTGNQLPVLKHKKVGDECEFEVKVKLTSISEGKTSNRYALEVTEMEYKGSSEQEDKSPMEAAYDGEEISSEDASVIKLSNEPQAG